MGKLLRVLIIFIFLLGVGALVLAYMLYEKRLEFSQRLEKFESNLPKIAAWMQTTSPQADYPSHLERDIDDVTSRELSNPGRNNFWSTYNQALEDAPAGGAMLNYNDSEKRRQLRKLFATTTDANGKEVIVKDELTRKSVTDGTGTMQALLDEIIKCSRGQYEVLVNTRTQMRSLREEYQKTIADLNEVKRSGRVDKKTIDTLNGTISRLEMEKSDLEQQIRRLEDEKKLFIEKIAELNDVVIKKETELKELGVKTEQIAADRDRLQKRVTDLENRPQTGIGIKASDDINDDEWRRRISPGDKGVVVAVDNNLNFVVLRLDPSFGTDNTGVNIIAPLQKIPLSIRRPGLNSPSGEFVTRVRLSQVVPEKNLYVADILIDWQQTTVEIGDIVYFN